MKTIEFECIYGGQHPVVGEVWYRFATARGDEAERYDRYLCAALTMMAHRPSECDVIMARIDAVMSGKVDEDGYGLNDTCVTFRGNVAQVDILIEDEIGIAAGRFGLDEYRKTLHAWKEFLLLPEGAETKMKLELP